MTRPPVAQYLFAQFRLDLNAHQLFRGGEAVLLSAKAWDTLLVLVTNRHRVVGKDELLSLVWPGKSVSEDLLPQNILALRRALGDDSGQPKFIATTPRRGYRFVAAVTEVTQDDRALQPDGIAQNGEAVSTTAGPAPVTIAASEGRGLRAIPPIVWIGLATLAASIALVAVVQPSSARSQPASGGHPLRFSLAPPDGASFASGGILSPNGRDIAFVATEEATGKSSLWLRSLDTAEARTLEGTEDASMPFWSPDSQSVGFFAGGKLKRVGLDGTAPRVLTDVGLSPGGATWGPGGVILFARWKAGVSSVAETGGAAAPVTKVDAAAQEVAHVRPQFLPGGRRFLYTISSANPQRAGTWVGSLDGPEKTHLADGIVTYAAPGYLLSEKDGAVMAQRFDPARLKVSGPVSVVAGNASVNAVLSAAAGDLLAFGGPSKSSRLVWYSRTGRMLSTIDAPAHLHNFAFSHDLKQLIASSSDADQRGVWLVDLARGAPTRFVPYGTSPWASPDGRRIVFTSDRFGGVADVYARSVSGRNDDEIVLRTPENKIVNDWSPDGRYLIYVSTNPVTKKDIWLLPQDGGGKPIPYLQTPADEIQAQVSPNGHWMAYASDESGGWQVYVQTFPVPGRKRVVSVNGGAQPRWRHDGRELFYLASDHTLMAVDMTAGETLEPGLPHALFRADVVGRLNTYRSHYAVTADGQRFLVDSSDGSASSITTLVNWTALVKP